MPKRPKAASLILFSATPRFEIFYALQVLCEPDRPKYAAWKRNTSRALSRRLRTSLQRLAPSPLLWPLLADALCDAPPMIPFSGMLDELKMLDNTAFQRAVLGGVFKNPKSVDSLIAGDATLAAAVAAEAASQTQLLSVLGLLPFRTTGLSTQAIQRIVTSPGEYKTELVDTLDEFWTASFAGTWESLKPRMVDACDKLEEILASSSLDEFSRVTQLPLKIEDDAVVSGRGSKRHDIGRVDGIHIIPSAFNTGRFWASYTSASERTQFFIPLLRPELWPMHTDSPDPSLGFKALGDTTRYAIAATIARTPMTSVDLARAFKVSKPTISHHVQILRSARLLEETSTENGVVLGLDRSMLERISGDAAAEMFSEAGSTPVVRRTRKISG